MIFDDAANSALSFAAALLVAIPARPPTST